MATIDQYFATSTHLRWQQWCNIKLARRLPIIFVRIWTLEGIPFFIFYNHIILPTTNQTTCDLTNEPLRRYMAYGYYLILTNLIPIITAVFALMAYQNARYLTHRTIPLVRHELDKQLTVMVLVQVLISFTSILPFTIQNVYTIIFVAQLNLANIVIWNFCSVELYGDH